MRGGDEEDSFLAGPSGLSPNLQDASLTANTPFERARQLCDKYLSNLHCQFRRRNSTQLRQLLDLRKPGQYHPFRNLVETNQLNMDPENPRLGAKKAAKQGPHRRFYFQQRPSPLRRTRSVDDLSTPEVSPTEVRPFSGNARNVHIAKMKHRKSAQHGDQCHLQTSRNG